MKKGLYANIHAKRKRGGKMRKKGAKGAPAACTDAKEGKGGWWSEQACFWRSCDEKEKVAGLEAKLDAAKAALARVDAAKAGYCHQNTPSCKIMLGTHNS